MDEAVTLTMDPSWVAAAASCGTLAVGVLTYRLVRRQGVRVSWEVEEPVVGEKRKGLVLRNVGTAIATEVEVEFSGPAPPPRPIAVSKDVHPGGVLRFTSVRRMLNQTEPTVVELRWRTRLGLKRSWSTALG